jgi:hypothetical protein
MGANPGLSAQGGFDNTNVVFPGAAVIAAAATIAPKKLLTFITGSVPIATITPPSPYFTGPLYLVNTAGTVFTTVTTGNIALASTAVAFKALCLVYDALSNKWYPSY